MDGLDHVFEGVAAERAAKESRLGRSLTYDEAILMSHRHVDHWLSEVPPRQALGHGFFWFGVGLRVGMFAVSFLALVILIAWVLL